MNRKPNLSPVDLATSDITPITREPIENVHAHQWSEMSISELHTEKAILQERANSMYDMNKPTIAKQIERGIAVIDSLINKKSLKQ